MTLVPHEFSGACTEGTLWGQVAEVASEDRTSDPRSQDRTGPQTWRDVGRREGRDRAERENGVLSRQRVLKETFVQCEVSKHKRIATGLVFHVI